MKKKWIDMVAKLVVAIALVTGLVRVLGLKGCVAVHPSGEVTNCLVQGILGIGFFSFIGIVLSLVTMFLSEFDSNPISKTREKRMADMIYWLSTCFILLAGLDLLMLGL